MVRQELDLSCGAACVRQMLLDAGVGAFPEADVRKRAGFDPEFPLDAGQLAAALNSLHPGAMYRGGGVLPDDLDALTARGPFLALLKVSRGKHWIIVDQVSSQVSEPLVYVRDPAGRPESEHHGAEAVMRLDVFLDRWRRAFNGVVFRSV